MEGFMRSLGYFKTISRILIFAMLHLCWLTSYGYAEMLPTESAVQYQTNTSTQTDRERILDLLNRQEVVGELEKYGINKVEAIARINSLTDEEVTQIAGKLDELPEGGNIGAAIGYALVLAVLLALYIPGVIIKGIGCIFIDCEDSIFQPWWIKVKKDEQYIIIDQCYSDCNTNYRSCINSDIEDNILATKCGEKKQMCFQKCESKKDIPWKETIKKDCDPGMESCI
jgi:hypothetical protein